MNEKTTSDCNWVVFFNFWNGPGREKSFDNTEKSALNLAKLPSLSWFVENRQRCSSEESPNFTDQFVRHPLQYQLMQTSGLRIGLR